MKFGIKKRDDHVGTEIDVFRKNMTKLFDDFFNIETTGLFETSWVPAVDVEEDEKNIVVKADIPGIDEKDLNVQLENNILSISGEKKEEKRSENKDKKQIVTERSYGSFRRSIGLPEGIKPDRIKAEFKKGVLSIVIPKEKTVESKKVTIDVK